MKPYFISIVKGTCVFEQVNRAIQMIGGMETFVRKGDRVLIKPNMTGPASFKTGVTTNPAVVEALISLSYQAGAREVDIGDGTGSIHVGSVKVMELCGMQEIINHFGGKLVDLNKGKMTALVVENGFVLNRVMVSERFLGYDTVINVPVLKTHFITEVSLGMKNLKGCIPPSEKRRFHNVGVNMAVADLNKTISCQLTVVDGTVAAEGLGPKEGRPVGFQTVIAGANVLAVDMVSASVMGFEAKAINHISMAVKHGIGPKDISEIQIKGCEVNDIKREFLKAIPSVPDSKQAYIQNFESCSGCMGCAAITITRLQEMGFFQENPNRSITLVIGTKVPLNAFERTDTFLIGNCAIGKRQGENCMPGCAPSALDTANMILNHYEISRKPFV